jgi:DNA-binding CsgD family transcriptional regulator
VTSLAQDTLLPGPQPCVEGPLLGRAVELAFLQRHLEEAVSGTSRLLFIEGEAGIGKSRLLAEALDRARTLGFTILRGAGEEIGLSRPFGVLAGAFRRCRSSVDPDRIALDQLLARREQRTGLGLSRPPEQPWQVLEASLDVLEELATSTPVVLALEDLHWADPSSLLVIRAVASHLATHPVVVVGTLRPVPRVSELDRLVDDLVAGGATRLVLGPLEESAVAELVTSVVDAPPGPDLLAQAAGAAGNPLFVLEWLRALVEEAKVELTSGQAELMLAHRSPRSREVGCISDRSLPPAFARSVLRRLNYLSSPALEALQLAAILGSTFSLADLSLVTARPVSSLLAPVSEALAAGLLEDAASQLSFRHALIHQAIYTDLPLGVRAGMHQQVGQALAAAGAPAGQVAHHLARGAGPGDDEAVGWLQRAAQETALHAPVVCADLLARALELAPPSDPRRSGLLAQRAMALVWSGRVDEGEEVARQALSRCLHPAVEADLRLGLGRALVMQGRGSEAITHLNAGGCLPGVGENQKAQLRAEASYAWLSNSEVAIPVALAEAEKAAAAGESADDDLATCAAWCTRSLIAHLRGDPASAVAYATQAVDRATTSPEGEAHSRHPRYFLGVALLGADRFAEAKETLEAGRRQADQLGTHWGRPHYHAAVGRHHVYTGEWDDAVAEFEAGVAQSEETGSRAVLVWLHGALARLAVHRDDLPTAEEALGRAVATQAATRIQFGLVSMLWAEALLHEARGEADTAVRMLARLWRLATTSGIVSEVRDVGPDLVRLACIVGARDLTRSVIETLEEAALRAGTPSYEGAALYCRGLAERDPELLLAAVAAYRRSGRPVETAMALEQAAVPLGQAGRLTEAAPLVDEAITTYEQVGAVRDAARAVATLRSFGIRRGRRGPRRRPTTGWASLTVTEQHVVRLVIEGLTNAEVGQRLFISRRTVETHLAHVFAKLGISSRRQLAKMGRDPDLSEVAEPKEPWRWCELLEDHERKLA